MEYYLSFAIWGEKELMSIRFYIGFIIVLGAILLNGIYKRKNKKIVGNQLQRIFTFVLIILWSI